MNWGKVLAVIALVIGGLWLGGIVLNLLVGILKFAVPVAIVGGVGYLVYRLVTKPKSIGGNGPSLY